MQLILPLAFISQVCLALNLEPNYKLISNSVFDRCGTWNSSDLGCGINLNCDTEKKKCVPDSQLDEAIGKECSNHLQCPPGSHCRMGNEPDKKCRLCQSKYTTCGKDGHQNYHCCSGSSCTTIITFIDGQRSSMRACIPNNLFHFHRAVFSKYIYSCGLDKTCIRQSDLSRGIIPVSRY